MTEMGDMIIIGADHAGLLFKEHLKQALTRIGIQIMDINVEAKVLDYREVAKETCLSIEQAPSLLGILICGTGIGMSIVANRYPFIRAAVVSDVYSAIKSREHNHANILCLGARVIGVENGEMIAQAWLKAELDKTYRNKLI